MIFAVCRFDPPNGRKEVLPFTCDGQGWHWKGPEGPRPIYGLDRLAAREDAPVIVVEGEKAADRAAEIFPELVAISWPGGAQSVGRADWSALRGRSVVIWPDADAPGRKAAAAVAKEAAKAGAASIQIVDVPDDWPPGWDLADFGVEDRPQPVGIDQSALRRMLISASWHMEASRVDDTPDVGTADAAQDRIAFHVDRAELPVVAADLARHLSAVPNLFDRAGPVYLVCDPTTGATTLAPLNVERVLLFVHDMLRPYELVKMFGKVFQKFITMPDKVAKLYLELAKGEGAGLRPLRGISFAPALHDSGAIRAVTGYDPATLLWCVDVADIAVPERPSRDEAAQALYRLRNHFKSFPFADSPRTLATESSPSVVDIDQPPGADESALLCGLLTAVCRPSLPLAPALLFTAPEMSGAGTGKGLLARTICGIAFGEQPAAMTMGPSAEEFEKRLGSMLLDARPAVLLDNLNGMSLKSDFLASVVAENPAAIRPLGHSKTIRVNSSALIIINGNGLAPSEDLARRMLITRLDAGVENPEARPFTSDLIEETKAKRADLLSAALTIWRWGRRLGEELPKGRYLGSFGQWGRWCRDPLLALGCQDPALRVAEIKALDPRRQAMIEAFEAWWAIHRDEPVTARELDASIFEAFSPGPLSRQRASSMLNGWAGTRIEGYHLLRLPKMGTWATFRYQMRFDDQTKS
ncbi:hypothetical protein [Roseomonas sp. 18066]|uniref:hypothetical protein n=1 Tax=Roseomonas sp. 18066 TaxID=2681412 RepID=UPI00135B13AE|nr:hypothetical protein [Roseomonas sp. 18066]